MSWDGQNRQFCMPRQRGIGRDNFCLCPRISLMAHRERSGVSPDGSPAGQPAIRCWKVSTTGMPVRESPSQLEVCFAIFINVLELDDHGDPVNDKHAERRAATWLYRYCTGELPPGEPDLELWECELY